VALSELRAFARKIFRVLLPAHEVARAPRSRCDQLSPGERVRVVGTATTSAALIRAPCSGVECIAWELSVYHRWTEFHFLPMRPVEFEKRLVSTRRGVDFTVEEQDGSVLVPWCDATQLMLVLSEAFTRKASSQLPDGWSPLLGAHRFRDFSRGELCFVERRLEQGVDVAIVGTVERLPGAAASYRSPSRHFALVPADGRLVICNERGALAE
jgi:hypothetical protein